MVMFIEQIEEFSSIIDVSIKEKRGLLSFKEEAFNLDSSSLVNETITGFTIHIYFIFLGSYFVVDYFSDLQVVSPCLFNYDLLFLSQQKNFNFQIVNLSILTINFTVYLLLYFELLITFSNYRGFIVNVVIISINQFFALEIEFVKMYLAITNALIIHIAKHLVLAITTFCPQVKISIVVANSLEVWLAYFEVKTKKQYLKTNQGFIVQTSQDWKALLIKTDQWLKSWQILQVQLILSDLEAIQKIQITYYIFCNLIIIIHY